MSDESQDEPQSVKDLRAAHDRQKQRADSAEAAARELAFLKAGVHGIDPGDPNYNPVAGLFAKSYDGELTVEAVKAAVAEQGLEALLQPATPTTKLDPGDELAAQQQGQPLGHEQLAGGDNPPPSAVTPPQLDVLELGWKDFRSEIEQGRPIEDAAPALIGRILEGARNGDERFVFDKADFDAAVAKNS